MTMKKRKSIFSERLKKAFKETNLTQAQLAKMLGVEQTQISKYMLGKSFPTIEKFEKLLDIFDKEANYFFENSGLVCDNNITASGKNSKNLISESELLKKENEILKLKLELAKKKK